MNMMQLFYSVRFTCAALAVIVCVDAAAVGEVPLQVVQETTTRLLSALDSEHELISQRPEHAHEIMQRILVPIVDRNRIARLALGRYWREATPAQRARFIAEFETKLLRTYAAGLANYTSVDVSYLPVTMDASGTDATVRTRIRFRTNESVAVDYRLYERQGQWFVYDVAIAGISTVMTFRTVIAEQIRTIGLERFLDELSQQNRLPRDTS